MGRLTCTRACVAGVALLVSGCTSGSLGLFPTVTWQPSGGDAPQGHYETGKQQFAQGLLGLALESFKSALANDSNSVAILNAVGACYDGVGRYDLAQRYYMRALAIEPHAAQTLNNIGYSYVLQHDYGNAWIYLEKAAAAARTDEADQGHVIAGNLSIASAGLRGQSASRAEPQLPSDDNGGKQQDKIPQVWLQRSGEKVYQLITRPSPWAASATARLPEAVGGVPLGTQSGREDVEGFLRDASFLAEGVVTDWPPEAVGAPSGSERLARQGIETFLHNASFLGEGLVTSWSPKAARSPSRDGEPAEPRQALVEVSNGAGRRHLAADLSRYLESNDINVARLTNDVSFANQKTVMFYRDGYLSQARELAQLLPLAVELEAVKEQYSDIRIRLGHDILEFDRYFTPLYEEI